MANLDYDEKQAYLEIFRREAAIYEATPARHFISRSKLRKKVRYAYGDVIGSGMEVSMPLTTAQAFWRDWGYIIRRGWGHEFARGWLFVLTWITIFAAICAVVLWLIIGVGVFEGDPPKPLPPGIQQRGYRFIIPPDYALRQNYKEIRASDLCKRLPRWDSGYDDTESHSARDGSIIILCRAD